MKQILSETKIFKHSASKLNFIKALDYLIEECAELIVAAQHLKRKRINKKKFLKELVDVENMIGQAKEIQSLFDLVMYKEIKEKELNRLYNRS